MTVIPLTPSFAHTMILQQMLIKFNRGSLMNTRNVVLSFAVALCASLCSGGFARAQTTIAVSPASQNGTVGASVAVQIRINDVANLHGFSIVVEFDSSILQYQTADATNGTFLGSFLNFTYVSTQPPGLPSKVQVDQAILGTSTTSGSGPLFSITFSALNSGTSSIHVASIDLRDGTNNTIPASSSSGQVTVGGGGTAPPVPTLVSPSSRTAGISTTPTLKWHASGGATSYQLQLSTDSTFSITSVDQSGINDTSISVSGLLSDTTYYWRVRASNAGGTSAYSAVWSFRTTEPTSVKRTNSGVPTDYELSQNYPNPFNPSTVLQFDLPEPAVVTLKVYNTLGQEVAALLDNMNCNAGRHTVTFNASRLSSGVYIYRLIAERFVDAKKMVLLK
jgi:hypothetical protein